MNVGVGLPSTLVGATGQLIIDWARQADEGPFSSLATLDRLLYDSFDPLASLAAAAAVTNRIQLATTIVMSPLRSTAMLAKSGAVTPQQGKLAIGVGFCACWFPGS